MFFHTQAVLETILPPPYRLDTIIGHFLKKWANPGLFFVYFHPFIITISIIQIEKSVDGVLGTEICGRLMVGTHNTTELWRPPNNWPFLIGIENFVDLNENILNQVETN